MAGGMLPARGMSLEERSRLSGIAEAASNARTAHGAHRRHCWVTGPDEDPGPWPGLVLDWHRTQSGWRAWVVYLAGEGADQVTVQGWVGRERLTPAE